MKNKQGLETDAGYFGKPWLTLGACKWLPLRLLHIKMSADCIPPDFENLSEI
jgi:hypothetical protein